MISYRSPQVGPKAAELIRRDSKVMLGADTRTPDIPLVVERAEEMWVEDPDGRRYLDFGAGYAVCAAGHCHPQVVEAINSQARKLLHIGGSDFYYLPEVELAEKLVRLTPGDFPKRVYFANSGAESLEAAFKLSRYYTRRPKVISFLGAFHGRTYVGMSLSGSKKVQRAGFSPLIREVIHIPYPYCYRCPFHLKYPSCKGNRQFEGISLLPCVEYLIDTVFERLADPEEISAIFVETIQGEGGYIVPPPEFHPLLRAISRKYGIILVLDEIQSGMGRTGKLFAIEHWGVEPDVICVAKALASGLPLGAVVAKAELMDSEVDPRAWKRGAHGSTFGGNPVSCAAANQTLELLEDGLVENAARMGSYIKGKLEGIMERHRIIGDVRGKGLMLAFELVRDKESKAMFPREVTSNGKGIQQVFVGSAFKKGLILFGCGFNSIRLSPPLVVSQRDAELALGVIEEVVTEIEAQL